MTGVYCIIFHSILHMGTQKGDGGELLQNLRFQTEGKGKRLFKEEGLTERGIIGAYIVCYPECFQIQTKLESANLCWKKISIRLSILTST